MENLKAKLKKQGGFTMVELLIVVAIIAILVAVSIPMMNQALERSRHAVDQANVRDAIALASIQYTVNPNAFNSTTPVKYFYCVDKNSQGYLSDAADEPSNAVKPTCKCTTASSLVDTGLYVEIKAPADSAAIDARPDITTNWHFDGTSTKAGNAASGD